MINDRLNVVSDEARQGFACAFKEWLQQGAHLYVCGDAKRMARDVDAALLRIVSEQADLTEEAARAFINQLKSEKRYQRDVY